jgi:hypothetical protein
LRSGADRAVGSGPFTDVRAGRTANRPASSAAVDHAQAFGGSSEAATSATGFAARSRSTNYYSDYAITTCTCISLSMVEEHACLTWGTE